MRQTLMRGAVSFVLLLVQTLPANGLENLPATIQCEQIGATIPDDQSDTCATYYRCAVNSDNVLVPVFAQCPGTTVYSRELRQCVDASTYPCEGAASLRALAEPREVGFECTEEGRFPNVASTDCKSYYLCTKNTDGTLIAAVLNCPTSAIFSEENKACVSSPPAICPYESITTTDAPQSSSTLGSPVEPFVCPSEGRFVNEQSPDCSTYFLCLTISNQIVPQLTTCASGSIFSEIELRCVLGDSYTCPKLTVPTVKPPASTTTQVTTTTEVTTPVPLTTPNTGGTTTAATSEVTTNIPLTPPGPITISTTATTEVTTNIPLTPPGSSTISTTEAEATTSEMPSSTSDITDTTELTTNIPLTPPGSGTSTISTTEAETTTSEMPSSTSDITDTTEVTTELTSTTEELETPSSIKLTTSTKAPPTTAISISSTTSVDSQDGSTTLTPLMTTPGLYQCTAEGRYPDPNASNCESYMLCVKNSMGTLTPIQFFCPPTTIFSATLGICASSLTHSCVYETSTIEPPASTTPTATTTITPTPTPFVCTNAGKYPNPNSIYCKSYYLCIYDGKENLISVELSCPGSSIFATDELRCVPAEEYQCDRGIATTVAMPTTTSTTTTTTTTSSTTSASTSTSGLAGTCTMTGKFPTSTPNDCSSYQFCVMIASGDLVEVILTCPGKTLFDEEKKVCSDKYVCARGT